MNQYLLQRCIAPVVVALTLAGCSVNPVTGESQLSLIPENQELSMGAEQYTPTQQTQGGQFYMDPELTLYVREVGQKLAEVSDRPDLPYEFVVLNSSTPNAWRCLVARSPSTVAYSPSLTTKHSWPLCSVMKLSMQPPATAFSACSKAC